MNRCQLVQWYWEMGILVSEVTYKKHYKVA
jgi:hypothetical protein